MIRSTVFILAVQFAMAGLALGGEAAAPAGTRSPSGIRSPYPSIVVPQIVIPDTRPPALAAPQPPVGIQRPATITSCDPGGCWSSDGTRLNRMGPELTGPRGICNPQAGTANCP
ncbi:MAG: hypothetical protein V4757_03695 [Pseudomonadota bacterium]